MIGAYRSQWKRWLLRMLTFGVYGRKGMGWWNNPKKAWYNWWYYRTSVDIRRMFGYKPSKGSCFAAMTIAMIIGVFAAPVDVTRAGVAAHKIKKARKRRAHEAKERAAKAQESSESRREATKGETRSNVSPASDMTDSSSKTASATATTSVPKPATTHMPAPNKTVVVSNGTTPIEKKPPAPLFATPEVIPTYVHPEVEALSEPDENVPKSKPKHEGDQYIQKRMIIAGTSYCDPKVLGKLCVGTYIELEAEPSNPYDKSAVKLTLNGEKIGYIAKTDRLPFATCLKLKRKVYGVIIDIRDDVVPAEYEFETWFDQSK